jgi:hypothetical protein
MNWTQRILHGLAVGVTATTLGLLAMVVMFALALSQADEQRAWVDAAMWVTGTLLLAGGVLAIWKVVSWKVLGPVLLVCAGTLLWLAKDSPERNRFIEVTTVASKESKSYEVLMWMGGESPHSRVKERKTAFSEAESLKLPADEKTWSDFVAENRGKIAEAWEKDVVGREWIAALMQFPPSGVFRDGVKDPLLSFQATRSVFEHRFMQALALSLEGKAGEGVSILADSIRALRHIQKGAGTLVGQMIAHVLVKRSGLVVTVMLDNCSLSAAQRSDLATALGELIPGSEILRQAFEGERYFAHTSYSVMATEPEFGVLVGEFSESAKYVVSSRLIRPFIFNPKRGEREYTQFIETVTELSCARKEAELAAFCASGLGGQSTTKFRLKNPLIPQLAVSAGSAFTKVTTHFWAGEDQRLALIARLEGKGTESAK